MTAMIGPAPNGAALQFDIECTAAPADVFGVLHTVTIHPDWTVAVPHDLEAERVAALFGSWSSCERFASATVPAFRRMMEVMSGTSELPRTPGGLWETSRAPGCCSQPSVFESHFQALMHEIGPAHLAAVFGTTPRAVQDVTGVDKSANERILLLADISMTYNGVFNSASNFSNAVFQTVPSTSVPRVNTLQPTSSSEPNLTFTCIFTDYQLTRSATGELTWQVPGSGSSGTPPAWT